MAADPFSLRRFLAAQEDVYDTALAELRAGRKRTHWMWFVFPQFEGLGASATSHHFAIRSLDEARAYLEHPVLGARVRECADALLSLASRSASDFFGYPDDLKLHSSMTLFDLEAAPGSVFGQVLDRYFGGSRMRRPFAWPAKRDHPGKAEPSPGRSQAAASFSGSRRPHVIRFQLLRGPSTFRDPLPADYFVR